MIPQEAICAAVEAVRNETYGASYSRDLVRIALEAAAPFLRAQALEDAADDINAGSCDSNYSPEACETCRAVETLRDSAATERGQG